MIVTLQKNGNSFIFTSQNSMLFKNIYFVIISKIILSFLVIRNFYFFLFFGALSQQSSFTWLEYQYQYHAFALSSTTKYNFDQSIV